MKRYIFGGNLDDVIKKNIDVVVIGSGSGRTICCA